jgi:hypothetical protein
MTQLHDLTIVMSHLQDLFPSAARDSVTDLNQSEILEAFFRLMASQKIAVLHLDYPRDTDGTHKTMDALAAALAAEGLTETADLIAGHAPYIITENLVDANHLLLEIKKDSAPVHVALHYQGHAGTDAEALLHHDIKEQILAAHK